MPAYLYYGMRTKYCTKIKEAVCRDVKEIIISKSGIVMIEGRRLSEPEKEALAVADGFRAEKAANHQSASAFYVMLRWWKQTNGLPFIGDIIYW